jgi:TolB protein
MRGVVACANKSHSCLTDTPGTFQIYVIHPDGSGLKQLTNIQRTGSAAGIGTYSWSPDGAWIVFSSDRDSNREIYTMSADGSNPVNLTGDKGYDDSPAWSPVGKHIAFVSDRSGEPGIYVMNVDGTNVMHLSKGLPTAVLPRWSADGTKIAFVSDEPRESRHLSSIARWQRPGQPDTQPGPGHFSCVVALIQSCRI